MRRHLFDIRPRDSSRPRAFRHRPSALSAGRLFRRAWVVPVALVLRHSVACGHDTYDRAPSTVVNEALSTTSCDADAGLSGYPVGKPQTFAIYAVTTTQMTDCTCEYGDGACVSSSDPANCAHTDGTVYDEDCKNSSWSSAPALSASVSLALPDGGPASGCLASTSVGDGGPVYVAVTCNDVATVQAYITVHTRAGDETDDAGAPLDFGCQPVAGSTGADADTDDGETRFDASDDAGDTPDAP